MRTSSAILLKRVVISAAIGIGISWLVYAFAGDSIPGNAYIAVAAVPAVLAFLLL